MLVEITRENGIREAILKCDQCDDTFRKTFGFTKRFHFCSKKCVYAAQRKGGVSYELRKKRSLEKHGTEFPMSTDAVKNTRRKNVRAKYGVDSVFQLESMKEKSKQTCLEKYGVEVYSQVDEFKERIAATNMTKFGYGSPIENPDVLARRRTTMLRLYGGRSTFESPVLRERAKRTCLERYGVPNIVYSPSFISSSMDKKLMKTHGKTWQQYKDELPANHDYRRRVDHVTRMQPIHLLQNSEKRGEYHLDHKYSVAEGFRNNVPVEIIGSIANLEFIPATDNMKKGAACSITEQQLRKLYYTNLKENTNNENT